MTRPASIAHPWARTRMLAGPNGPHAQSRPRLRWQAIGFRSYAVRPICPIAVRTDGNTSCRQALSRRPCADKNEPIHAGRLPARGGQAPRSVAPHVNRSPIRACFNRTAATIRCPCRTAGCALRSGRGPNTLCVRTWQVAEFPTLDAIRCPDLRSTSSADQPCLRGWRRSRKGSACATR